MSPAEEDPNTPESFRRILKEGKCCICEGSLRGGHLNFATIDKYATWRFPVWGNILVEKNFERAMAILCDKCVDPSTGLVKGEIKFAIEIEKDNTFRYHEVSKLKDAEPITEERVMEVEERERWR